MKVVWKKSAWGQKSHCLSKPAEKADCLNPLSESLLKTRLHPLHQKRHTSSVTTDATV